MFSFRTEQVSSDTVIDIYFDDGGTLGTTEFSNDCLSNIDVVAWPDTGSSPPEVHEGAFFVAVAPPKNYVCFADDDSGSTDDTAQQDTATSDDTARDTGLPMPSDSSEPVVDDDDRFDCGCRGAAPTAGLGHRASPALLSPSGGTGRVPGRYPLRREARCPSPRDPVSAPPCWLPC